jgi:hypothetical protein
MIFFVPFSWKRQKDLEQSESSTNAKFFVWLSTANCFKNLNFNLEHLKGWLAHLQAVLKKTKG